VLNNFVPKIKNSLLIEVNSMNDESRKAEKQMVKFSEDIANGFSVAVEADVRHFPVDLRVVHEVRRVLRVRDHEARASAALLAGPSICASPSLARKTWRCAASKRAGKRSSLNKK